jgi:GntR family transcriptional regulator, transcriptional repressor for pyruvate dehydrogenase complex
VLSDLLTGPTLRELYEVRRILEPAATALAASRLTDEDFAAIDESLERMDAAETTQAFIDADVDFHRVIVNACGNATLASLIQNLAGGTLRARTWRAIHERGALESTKRLHHDIYYALRQRDAEFSAAADLVHLAAGERWLLGVIDSDEPAGAGD